LFDHPLNILIKIAELEAKIQELENKSLPETSVAESTAESSGNIVKQGKDPKKRGKNQPPTVEDLEKKLSATTKELKESIEKEKREVFDAKQESKFYEDSLKETKTKLRMSEERNRKFEHTITEKEEAIEIKERELESIQGQLKAKEAIIEKLTAISFGGENRDDEPRRSGMWMRRDSLRRQSYLSIQNISSPSLVLKPGLSGEQTGLATHISQVFAVTVFSLWNLFLL